MAVFRETPTCPWCGKVIAKAIYRTYESWQQPIYGDDFIGWETIEHKCKKEPKEFKESREEFSKKMKEIINKIGTKQTNK